MIPRFGGIVMSEHNDETLARDIRDFAQALLDHPVIGRVVRDAGTHRNFSKEEQGVLDNFSRNADFLKQCIVNSKNGANHGVAYRGNMIVSVGVARRVATGEFSSVDDPAALKLIKDYMVSCAKDITRGSSDPLAVDPRTRKIRFDDFYRVLQEY